MLMIDDEVYAKKSGTSKSPALVKLVILWVQWPILIPRGSFACYHTVHLLADEGYKLRQDFHRP